MAKNNAKTRTGTDNKPRFEDKRAQDDRRKTQMQVTVERRKVHRRRQIDPTTCEREYTDQEIEFMHALDEYKRSSGRMFPTCSEILEVLHRIGYRKVAAPLAGYVAEPTAGTPADSTISVG